MHLAFNEKLLPPRQGQTLVCAAKGLCIKLTARELSVTPQAIKGNRSALMHKLHASNTPHMIARAFELDMLRYIPIVVLCIVSALGNHVEMRPTRKPARQSSYTHVIARQELTI